jgi:hypothetical protein
MKRRTTLASGGATVAGLLLLGGVTLVATRAEARLIDLHAGALAGGVVGWGSRTGTPDFFEKVRGGAMGAEVGVKLLVLDLSVSFLQMIDGGGRSGTLSQAILGFEIDLPIGDARTRNGRRKLLLRPGFGGGVAFGTPGPVNPPLSNDQISDKGFVSQSKLALEYNPHPLVGFGVEGIFGYHYFVGAQAVNNIADHSSGYHLAALATATFHLGY